MINMYKEQIKSFKYDEQKVFSENVYKEMCRIAVLTSLLNHNVKKVLDDLLICKEYAKNKVSVELRDNLIIYTKHKYKVNDDDSISLLVKDIKFNNDNEILELIMDNIYNQKVEQTTLDTIHKDGYIDDELYKHLSYALKGNHGGNWGAYFGGDGSKGKGGNPKKDSWDKIKATMMIVGLTKYVDAPETWGNSDDMVLSWLSQYWDKYKGSLERQPQGVKISRRIVRWAIANGIFLDN